jgi:hypothetical protein
VSAHGRIGTGVVHLMLLEGWEQASCALEKQGKRLGSVLRQSAAVDGGHKHSLFAEHAGSEAVDSVPGRGCGRAVRKAETGAARVNLFGIDQIQSKSQARLVAFADGFSGRVLPKALQISPVAAESREL